MMARPTRITQKPVRLDCIDCRHSYDPHNVACDGTMIFCRCRLKDAARSVFCRERACERFEAKQG